MLTRQNREERNASLNVTDAQEVVPLCAFVSGGLGRRLKFPTVQVEKAGLGEMGEYGVRRNVVKT